MATVCVLILALALVLAAVEVASNVTAFLDHAAREMERG